MKKIKKMKMKKNYFTLIALIKLLITIIQLGKNKGNNIFNLAKFSNKMKMKKNILTTIILLRNNKGNKIFI